MLCATVKDVIVFTSIQRSRDDQQQAEHEQQVVDAEQDVLDAELHVGRGRAARPLVTPPSVTDGVAGRSRWLSSRPSAWWMRTSTSVIVVSSPAMRSVLPARPPAQVSVPRTSTAPGVSCCRSGVARRQPSGTTGAIWISTSPPVGRFQSSE